VSCEIYESGKRRAEVDGCMVTFLRMTGNVRRSRVGIWKLVTDDVRRARRLARRWAFKGKLGKPVVN
jgi:hypothetical protein